MGRTVKRRHLWRDDARFELARERGLRKRLGKKPVGASNMLSEDQNRQRANSLTEMRFHSYASYMLSSLWRDIRRRVLARDGHACQVCGQRAEQVHHSSYDLQTMQGKSLKRLHSICRECHEGLHAKRCALAPRRIRGDDDGTRV